MKRVVFFFDENSITESTEADVEAVITLADGRVITLPKLRGAIVCAPTKREADVCPFCQGRTYILNVYRKVTECPTCKGTGQRR